MGRLTVCSVRPDGNRFAIHVLQNATFFKERLVHTLKAFFFCLKVFLFYFVHQTVAIVIGNVTTEIFKFSLSISGCQDRLFFFRVQLRGDACFLVLLLKHLLLKRKHLLLFKRKISFQLNNFFIKTTHFKFKRLDFFLVLVGY